MGNKLKPEDDTDGEDDDYGFASGYMSMCVVFASRLLVTSCLAPETVFLSKPVRHDLHRFQNCLSLNSTFAMFQLQSSWLRVVWIQGLPVSASSLYFQDRL